MANAVRAKKTPPPFSTQDATLPSVRCINGNPPIRLVAFLAVEPIMNAILPCSQAIPLSSAASSTASPVGAAERLVSLDAFRGLVMILMASAGLSIPKVAEAYPNSAIWQRLAFHTDHVAWAGCGLWD